MKNNNKDLMIASVTEYSFNKALHEKIYAFPKHYKRDRTKKYIVFYRSSPVKAITHYSKVKNVKIISIDDFSPRD